MTRKESAQIVFFIRQYFPNFVDVKDVDSRITAWHLLLKDYNYAEAEAAVLAFVATDKKGFAPSVGQIVDKISSFRTKAAMTEMDAWNYVQKACRNSLYNAADEFKQLPDVVQCIVGSPEQLRTWALCSADEFNTVIQSNFMRSYRARANSEQEFLKLPSDVKKAVRPIAEMLEIKGVE